MVRKRTKIMAVALCCILAATSPLHSIAATKPAFEENGIKYGNYGEGGSNGYSVLGVDDSALVDGTLTIPDMADGKSVIYLQERFIANSDATKVVLGQNIKGLDYDAFFEAKNLSEISVTSKNVFVVSDGDPSLYTKNHNYLCDYPSAASNGGDYTVNEATSTIFSMDNTNFNTLNLNKTNTMARLVLSGSTVNELILSDNVRTTTNPRGVNSQLELPGLHAGKFTLMPAQGGKGSYLKTDGNILYTQDGTLIKIASGVEDGIDWSQIKKIDSNAFDSMEQYWSLTSSMPTELQTNQVFHFYNQNNGVFIVNGQTAFCYNSDKHIPDSVTKSADFSEVGGDNYKKVSAVMFVGVPYNGTGLFEQIFGVSYEEAVRDTQMSGNAALNAVSSMVWEIVDGKPSDVIQGIGGTDYFTKENVDAYTAALRTAANNADAYTFTPTFEINGDMLIFREQDNGVFLSDPFKVAAVNGKGEVDNNYKIHMTLSGSGFSIKDRSSMDFNTGETIQLESQTRPEGQPLSFTYKKGTLTYYTPGNPDDEQNLLVSGTKEETASILYSLEIRPSKGELMISKRAIGGSSELQGARLQLTNENGELIDQWISESTPHFIDMPADGTYVLTEITAPYGYEIAESITFVIRDRQVEGGAVIMYDKPIEPTGTATPSEATPSEPTDHSFTISKRDATNSNELPGAKLQIKDVNGNIVEEWTSSDTPHKVRGLQDGTYTLTEMTAPNGYDIAETITFTVKDGTVEGGTVIMYDQPTPSRPSGGGGSSSGSSSHTSSSSPTSGPIVTPVPESNSTPRPVEPVPQPVSDLPKTEDLPSSVLVFWAAVLTFAGLFGGGKKKRMLESTE